MRLQRKYTRRLVIGLTPEQDDALQQLALQLEKPVSVLVRDLIKSTMQSIGIDTTPRLANGHDADRQESVL